jgi:hypothetical protein
MSLRNVAQCVGILAGMTVLGCGQPKPPTQPEVKGHVLREDGSPVKGVKLEFVPFPFSDMQSGATCPIALTDDQGAFKASDGKSSTIPPRRYKVTVKGVLPTQRGLTPKEFQDPETTPVDVLVPADGLGDLVIRVSG